MEAVKEHHLAAYWRSPEGRAYRSELSRRPEHLEMLKKARDARTTEQLEKAADGLRRWNASPEGKEQNLRNLEKIQTEWSSSPENLTHLARVHNSWARSPEGIAQACSNYPGLQMLVPTLRNQDGDLCQLCLETMNFRLKRQPLSVSVDHVIPIRAGGSHDPSNLWLAHLLCNMKKGAQYVGRPDGSTDRRS